MNRWRSRLLAALTVIAGVMALLWHGQQYWGNAETQGLVLLVPDNTELHNPGIRVWLDAASEEGFQITALRDSEFLSPALNRSRITGVILPDQVHRVASNILIESLSRYVAAGGHLMLVYDAGIWTLNETYAPGRSRLSRLAGVDYALYDRLGEKTTVWGPVIGNRELFSALQVPPGKSVSVSSVPALTIAAPGTAEEHARWHTLSGYDNIMMKYDSFATMGNYDGQVLLRTSAGHVAAGVHPWQQGRVLYVNLPLGYLKHRTDGLMLHGFLQYFGDTMLRLPRLAAVPDGVGGLVMNWHLDSRVSLPALRKIKSTGIFDNGPYSIHLTAGPDARRKGDGLGLDVDRNRETRQWLQYFGRQGYEIGSHGGWIHDYFGERVPDKPAPEFEHLLRQNKIALELITAKPVTEYSAPQGNHPAWVTDWLAREGIVAYYFTGNSGMAPTRSYRDGSLVHRSVWSFPILTWRDTAGFEELRQLRPATGEVARWLRELTDFSVVRHTSRLIYFHPRGAVQFPDAIRSWTKHAAARQGRGEFRWYTMTQLAQFLNKRDQVQWHSQIHEDELFIRAKHPQNLLHMSWLLPATAYSKPEVTRGQARVHQRGEYWLVVAEEEPELVIVARRAKQNPVEAADGQ